MDVLPVFGTLIGDGEIRKVLGSYSTSRIQSSIRLKYSPASWLFEINMIIEVMLIHGYD